MELGGIPKLKDQMLFQFHITETHILRIELKDLSSKLVKWAHSENWTWDLSQPNVEQCHRPLIPQLLT